MARKNLESYIELINNAEGAENSFNVLTNIMQDFGYDKIAFSLVTDHPSLNLKRTHGLTGNFPKDWLEHYTKNSFFDVDPVPDRMASSSCPFFWSSLINPQNLQKDSLNIMLECEDAGLNDGAAIPLYTSGGEVASIVVARQNKSGDNSYEDLAAIQFLSTYFHESYKELIGKSKTKELTRKESELLLWASEGKTDSEIADILNISVSTVRYRWNNIFKKLDAYGRIYAITKAIRMSLISPYAIKNYQKR